MYIAGDLGRTHARARVFLNVFLVGAVSVHEPLCHDRKGRRSFVQCTSCEDYTATRRVHCSFYIYLVLRRTMSGRLLEVANMLYPYRGRSAIESKGEAIAQMQTMKSSFLKCEQRDYNRLSAS